MPVSLMCLMGLPGSGKTTLAGLIKDYLTESGVVAVTMEYDSYIVETHYNQGEWKRRRQELLEEVRHVATGLMEKEGKSLVLLDDNFYYRSMRHEVYKVAKELRLGFGQVFLNVPFDLCCSQNATRPKPVPVDVMLRMKSLIEPPEPSQNSWEKHSLVLSEIPTTYEAVLELFAKTLEDPVVPEPETQHSPQENSTIHYADLALRQIVKSIIISTPCDQRAGVTLILAQKKKAVLEDVKTRNICLPPGDHNADVVSLYVKALEAHFSAFLN